LQLTDEERTVLERYVRRGTTAQRLSMRSRIVLACAEGLNNKKVARRFKNVGYKTADGRFIRLRGGGRPGLARVDAPQGTLVAFSTAPGAAAMDGRGSANSLYTRHLLENISVPGLPVEQLFKRVRIAVAQETRRMQIPWESSSLMGDFCFRRSPAGTCEPGEQGLGMRF
jgi:hypothetical protein